MPGDLIKLIDTQADWQSGTLEGLDATTTPGLVIPTGDYSKVYDSQAGWDAGAKSSVVSTEAGDILLDKPVKGNTSTVNTVVGEDSVNRFGQRISARGLLSYVAIYVASSDSARVLEVRSLDGALLWSTSFDGSGLWSGNPNLIVDEDVLVCAKAADTLWVRYAVEGDYPPGVTENGRRLKSDGSLDSYFSVPLYVQYKCEYAPSGTWTSPWLAHSIASPESGLLALADEVPSGTSVTAKTRYSSDGGGTYTEWFDLVDGILQNVTGTHVQVQLTLATEDTKNTPVVSKATLLVGKIHRWTSPAIDLSGVEEDATLMLPTSQTELDVVREIRRGINLAANGSFETDSNSDGVADDWTAVLYGVTPSLADDAFAGSKSQQLTSAEGGTPSRVQQSIAIEGGKSYTLSGKLKTDGTVPGRLYFITNGTAVSGNSSDLTPTSWTDVSVSFTAPVDATSVTVRCYNYATDVPGWVRWDGVQLEEGDSATDYDDWQTVGQVFDNPGSDSLQARLTLTKTGTAEQSLDSVALWEAVTLKIRGRPRVTLSPPEITHVKVYVEDSEPLVEYTASLDVRADQRVDHPPIAVPAGSNEAYCQQVAEAVLTAKSKERVSLQCVVPLVTRLRFGELVPVVLPYMGYTRDEPYMARVQRMEHDVLRGITTLALGDFLPEDEEALVRLLKGGK